MLISEQKLKTMVNLRHKKISLILLLAGFSLFFLTACGGGQAADNGGAKPAPGGTPAGKSGDEIAAEYLKRDATLYRKVRVRFTVRAEDEPEKIYELDTWRRQTPEGTTTVSRIVKPAEDADLGSLTIEPKGQKATVVTYVASRGEFRETDTKKMFFGGLTAGELLGEWDKFTFGPALEKEIAGVKVFEVDGKIKPDADSIAARMKVAFRADNYVPVEVHLFDNNDREIRSLKVTDIKGEPDHPYPARTEVDNPIYKARIIIEILTAEFPDKLDEAIFTREKLKEFAKK